MADLKETRSSKTNLNESTLPLLEEGEVKIELEPKNEGDVPEKNDKEGEWFDAEDVEAGRRKRLVFSRLFAGKKKVATATSAEKKKEKIKVPKPAVERKPRVSPLTHAQNLSIGLNVLNRDEKEINRAVNVQFDDVLGETDHNQGFEFVWRLTFLIFNWVRVWSYRLVATVIAVPLAIIWALVFAAINVISVWALTPILRVYDIVLFHLHRVWSGLVRSTLDPIFTSIGLIYASRHQAPTPSTVA